MSTPARRLFDADGNEIFHSKDIRRDEEYYVSSGENFKTAETQSSVSRAAGSYETVHNESYVVQRASYDGEWPYMETDDANPIHIGSNKIEWIQMQRNRSNLDPIAFKKTTSIGVGTDGPSLVQRNLYKNESSPTRPSQTMSAESITYVEISKYLCNEEIENRFSNEFRSFWTFFYYCKHMNSYSNLEHRASSHKKRYSLSSHMRQFRRNTARLANKISMKI
jgi:hypothetical protein